MTHPIIICLSSDDNYAQHSAVVMEGILSNHQSKKPIEIHYLDGGVTKENKAKIQQVVDKYDHAHIIFHAMDDAYQEFSVDRHITHASYYRLKVAELLPNIDKVIYLDTDIVILDDIEKLWNIDIHDYSLAAVEDIGLRKDLSPTKERLNIPQGASYVNAGVLLMNLTRWREKQIGETILEYLKTHPNLQYHDQDALNAVLWNDLLLIPQDGIRIRGFFSTIIKKIAINTSRSNLLKRQKILLSFISPDRSNRGITLPVCHIQKCIMHIWLIHLTKSISPPIRHSKVSENDGDGKSNVSYLTYEITCNHSM